MMGKKILPNAQIRGFNFQNYHWAFYDLIDGPKE
jgi:hypothetical protein